MMTRNVEDMTDALLHVVARCHECPIARLTAADELARRGIPVFYPQVTPCTSAT